MARIPRRGRVPAMPLPDFVLTTLYVIRMEGGYYDQSNGGQWVPGTESRTAFQGTALPLTNRELITAQANGWNVADDCKVYTNDFELLPGQRVTDGQGKVYLIKQALDHDYMGIVKVYQATKKSEVES